MLYLSLKYPSYLLGRKPRFFVSKNTTQVAKDTIKSLVGVNSTQSYEKYLGLPSLIGRSRIRSFKSIEGRIWEKLNGWKEKNLSRRERSAY
jgi:hypothetical protein